MPKFKLNAGEMIEILDSVHQNAYDKLQSALEQKVLQTMSEEEWLAIWNTGEWTIETSITFKENENV
jgi:hypothetical protein